MSLVRKASRNKTSATGDLKHLRKNQVASRPSRKVQSSRSLQDGTDTKKPMLFTQQLLSRSHTERKQPVSRKRRKREDLNLFKASVKGSMTGTTQSKENEDVNNNSPIDSNNDSSVEQKPKNSRRKRRSTKSLQAFKKSLSLNSSGILRFPSRREKNILEAEDETGAWGGSRSGSLGESVAKLKRKILRPSTRTLTRPQSPKSPKPQVNPILTKDVGELVKKNIVPQIKTSKKKEKRLSRRGLESNNESLNNLFVQNTKKKGNSVKEKKKNFMVYARKRYSKNGKNTTLRRTKRRSTAHSATSSLTLEALVVPGSLEDKEESDLVSELTLLRDQYKKGKCHSSSTLKSGGSSKSRGLLEQPPPSPSSNQVRSPAPFANQTKKKSMFSSLFRKKTTAASKTKGKTDI